MTVLRTFLIWSILGCNEIKYRTSIFYMEDNAGQCDR